VSERRTQIAAGAAGAAAAGAAAIAGKAVLERRAGGGDPGGPSRAYRLKRKEAVGDGVRRIAQGRADKAREELSEASGTRDVSESIHSARKDLKKLRSVLRLVRDELGEKLYRTENRRYRDAGRLLSESRDAEVRVETVRALEERFGDELPAASRDWLEALERERDEIVEAGRELLGLRIDRALAAIEDGRERISSWPLEADSWDLVGPGLLRGYRRSRRGMKRTRSRPSAENVHEWRKRAKDLWYQLRIVRDAWPPLVGEAADQAHELADLLGDHHDLALLAEDLRGRDSLEDRKRLQEAIDRRQEELLDEALDLGAHLLAEKPKAFGARLRAYWLAWRPV
jgi:CHAD domain-containing protein